MYFTPCIYEFHFMKVFEIQQNSEKGRELVLFIFDYIIR